jgi:plasmid stability protein
MAIIHYELPDDLHRALKIRAAEEGVTLKALIIRFLELGLGVERELTE